MCRNSFSGNIPRSLFALPSLLELRLSYNQFNGTFQLDNFQSLPNLTFLSLSGNSLLVDVGNVNSISYGGLTLKELGLASCNLSSFPDFIKHLDLEELGLANNSIAGEVPSWDWGKRLWYLDLSFNLLTNLQKPYHIPASLRYLRLASNQLKGELQMSIPLQSELSKLFLANNTFSGSIPISLCNATHLDFLDMSRNKLSGSIPPCLLENISVLDLSRNNISGSIPLRSLENISVLDLSQNNISGNIPDTFSMVCELGYLDLNNNALEGKIPKSIGSCMWLQYMNVGNNMINDTFPCMLSPGLIALVLHSNRFHGDLRCHGNWPSLKVLDVSSNHFSGSLESMDFSSWTAMVLPSGGDFGGTFGGKLDVALIIKGKMLEFHKIWSDFSTIDLSSNSFYGKIPNAIGDLNYLHQINFSHNALNGSIPKSFGRLSNLESLDLSVNQLAGRIPEELGGLTFL
ncbi:receptor-like protein 7 [Salvia hispanica]|uniref:receptor-like protein 7 n=1 Tax=Salvia hispanica TaxID=49212 RepID=UPI00200957AF|nr:receptor-like protein 7 [Salvia hispanica]